MTVTVTVYEAKTILSELLARVGAGEEVLIAEAGKPVARLVPAVEKPARACLARPLESSRSRPTLTNR